MDSNIPNELVKKLFFLKTVLTFEEGCMYVGKSKSHMYKQTSANLITFYKPDGRTIYFERKDLDSWMLRNRIPSQEEVQRKASKLSMSMA